MRRFCVILSLALAGCGGGSAGWRDGPLQAQPERAGRGGQEAELAARLAGATYGRRPGPAVACVAVADLRGNRGLGGGLLLFDGDSGRQWVTRAASCPALTYNRTVRLAAPVAQLCRGGAVEVLDAASGRPLATCTVGEFLTYAPR